MEFDDRLGFLLLGGLIGFTLGYIVRSLREIKDELDEVEKVVCHDESERGAINMKALQNLALLLVIAMTVWAAFASQKASNSVEETQKSVSRITMCNQQYLQQTIEALNDRTEYTQNQVLANVALQTAQAEFLQTQLADPPNTDEQNRVSLRRYFTALTQFIMVNGEARKNLSANPYPTNSQLNYCIQTGSLGPGEGETDE